MGSNRHNTNLEYSNDFNRLPYSDICTYPIYLINLNFCRSNIFANLEDTHRPVYVYC